MDWSFTDPSALYSLTASNVAVVVKSLPAGVVGKNTLDICVPAQSSSSINTVGSVIPLIAVPEDIIAVFKSEINPDVVDSQNNSN